MAKKKQVVTKAGGLRAYARHRGVTLHAVQKARDAGRITLVDGQISDFAKADKDWERNTTPDPGMNAVKTPAPSKRAKPSSENDGSFMSARTRREFADAELTELKLAKTQGELIDLEAVRVFEASNIVTARNELTVIGPELRDDLAACDDPVECEGMINRRIYASLERLTEFRVDVA